MTEQAVEDEKRDGYEPDPARWRVLGVSLLIGFMALLDVTIVNVAIPSIQDSLGASASGVQWVVSGYALTFGLLLVTGGRLGDAWGRRPLMLGGLVAFVAPVSWPASPRASSCSSRPGWRRAPRPDC